MAYTLGNKCDKNLCKRIVLLQLIIENVVTCFFLEHSVDNSVDLNVNKALSERRCRAGVLSRRRFAGVRPASEAR